jgi:hypothetical protein
VSALRCEVNWKESGALDEERIESYTGSMTRIVRWWCSESVIEETYTAPIEGHLIGRTTTSMKVLSRFG